MEALPVAEILEIQGDYLFYSLDYNYIYGKGKIELKWKGAMIAAGFLEINMADRTARLGEGCQITIGETTYQADAVDLNLQSLQMCLTDFQETIVKRILPAVDPPTEFPAFTPVSLNQLHASLIYFVGNRFAIYKNFAVYGFKTTVFIEGMQSVSFRKFRMDKGIDQEREQPFRIDKLWWYSGIGLALNSSLEFASKGKGDQPFYKHTSGLRLEYDIFRLLDLDPGYRINFTNNQKFHLAKNLDLTSNFSYFMKNMLHADLHMQKNFGTTMTNDLSIDYSRPAFGKEETWIRLNSQLALKSWGNLTLNAGRERKKQDTLSLSYQNQLWKKVNLQFSHSQSKLLFTENQFQKLSQTNFSASFTNKLFDLSAEYSLQRDRLQELFQTSPNIRLAATPFTLYNGILRCNFRSAISATEIKRQASTDRMINANTSLNIETQSYQVFPGTEFSALIQLEHFHDRNPINRALSMGYIFRSRQTIGKLWAVEFNYNYNTRREPTDWFIQGTHSQDWNAVIRFKESVKVPVSGWTSVSYDTKTGKFSTAYLDLKVSLIKNWNLQTQFNYDARFNKLHYDIFLYRRAGRFTFRFSYRSISKSPMVEVQAQ